MTSAQPLMFSPNSEKRDHWFSEWSWAKGMKQSRGSAQPRQPWCSLTYHCIINFPRTQWVKTTVPWLCGPGIQESSTGQFLCSTWHQLRSVQWWSAGRGLIWRVQHGSTHTSRAFVGLAGTLTTACSCGSMAWQSQGSQVLTFWLRAPRKRVPRDLGGSCKASYVLTSKVPECHFCSILLMGQVTKASPALRRRALDSTSQREK